MSIFQYLSIRFIITLQKHKRRWKDIKKNSDEKLLSDLLEKILFNENDLNEFKTVILNGCTGNNHTRLLKEKVIRSRLRILEELLDIFPFYTNYIDKKRSIKNFIDSDQNPEIIKDLLEKNELLTEIGGRLNIIYEKLQKNI